MKTPQEWINEDGLPDHYADQIRILADIQADARAELLERIEKLRKLVEDIDCSDLMGHDLKCSMLLRVVQCDCGKWDLQQRINEALEP